MSLRISKTIRSRESIVVLAAVLAAPCAAQQQLDRFTADVLSSAIDALAREEYGAARGVIATLQRETLSPFERGRVEQILFNVAYQERRYDEARLHLERAIGSGGLTEREVAQARYQGVQLLMVEERWHDGAAALEEWLATTPQPDPAAYYLLAVAYYQSDEPAKALPAARAAIERMEQPEEHWLALLTALHLQQEQLQEALPLLNRLIVVAPAKKSYWLQLSSVYGRIEDYANALAIMQLAYNGGMLTESAEILRLADLLLFNDLPLRAGQVLEEALAASAVARDETTYSKLAASWLEAGEFDKAMPALEQAAALAATGAPLVRLGQVHLQRDDWVNAEAALGRALAKGGLRDAAEAQFLMGVALFGQERLNDAKFWFEQSRSTPSHHDMSEQYLRAIARETRPAGAL